MISPGLSSCEHSLNTLRYADRVKELAANGPSENKASPEQDRGSPNADDLGLDDSDLAQLRSLNVRYYFESNPSFIPVCYPNPE